MFLCVTPNPALDRTLILPEFQMGRVFRVERLILAAGGKGINVARVIQQLGAEAHNVAFVGGHTGRYFAELAKAEGLRGDWVEVNSETRCCMIVADQREADTAVLNELGPTVTGEDWNAMYETVMATAAHAEITCFCGSLPPGSPVEAYERLLRDLRERGDMVWVDTSGSPLRAALDVPGVNVKVNLDEAAAVLGERPHDVESAAKAAHQIAARTGGAVVLTMGKGGAVMVADGEALHGTPPQAKTVSTVGSGDAFLGGLVTGLAQSPEIALRRATAAGTANAMMYGGGLFSLADFEHLLDAVEVTRLAP